MNEGSVRACLRARVRTFSETLLLTEKQDTGKEATICKQMPKDELLHPQKLLWVLLESQKQSLQEAGPGNAM